MVCFIWKVDVRIGCNCSSSINNERDSKLGVELVNSDSVEKMIGSLGIDEIWLGIVSRRELTGEWNRFYQNNLKAFRFV
jgi:hypothetical protein